MTIANGSAGESYEERLLAIGDWVCATPLEGDADHAARRLLLDTLACAIAGMRKVDLRYLGGDASAKSGAAHVILGAPSGLGPAEAAYVVALAACADEACEGLAFAHGRPGLHAVAAAVGAALRVDASLGQMLAAIAAACSGRNRGSMSTEPGAWSRQRSPHAVFMARPTAQLWPQQPRRRSVRCRPACICR